jgi:hypothetical protein
MPFLAATLRTFSAFKAVNALAHDDRIAIDIDGEGGSSSSDATP